MIKMSIFDATTIGEEDGGIGLLVYLLLWVHLVCKHSLKYTL